MFTKIQPAILLVIAVVTFSTGISLTHISVVQAAKKPAIPAGCPGSPLAGPPAPGACAIKNECTKDNCDLIQLYLNPAINLLTVMFGLIAAGSIILGGIQFSTSEGDPQKAASAKDRIAGTILAVFAYAFVFAFLQFIIPGGVFNR